jgi:hypothetical protein
MRSGAISLKWPMATALMLSIYFRFRRYSGHGWTWCWLKPVANDPDRTSMDRQMAEVAVPRMLFAEILR